MFYFKNKFTKITIYKKLFLLIFLINISKTCFSDGVMLAYGNYYGISFSDLLYYNNDNSAIIEGKQVVGGLANILNSYNILGFPNAWTLVFGGVSPVYDNTGNKVIGHNANYYVLDFENGQWGLQQNAFGAYVLTVPTNLDFSNVYLPPNQSVVYYSYLGTSTPSTPVGPVVSILPIISQFTSVTGQNKNLGNPSSSCPMACDGNPINSATGNKFQVETDFVGAPSTKLELKRFYNALETVITGIPFGSKWHDTWHRTLVQPTSTAVNVISANGRMDTFTKNSSGVWASDPDVTSKLTAVMIGTTQTGWQVITEQDSTELYSTAGQLVSITDRVGNATSLTYDSQTRLSVVTGPYGHKLTFSYSSATSTLVSNVTLPDGGGIKYGYDASNNLVSVTYPDKAVRQYVYNEQTNTPNANLPHALTGIVDESGNRFATYQYDTNGRAILSQHAGGADKVSINYNNGTSDVTDALGNVHSYIFTTMFGVVKPKSVSGAPVMNAGAKAYTYDTNGFVASRTDWNGNVTTYTHDTQGNETSRTEASGGSQARTITTTWHPTFHLPTQITEPNRVTTLSYDSHGNLTQKTIADASNSKNTRTWNYAYNANGQVTQADGPRTDVADITQYSYDAKGDLASVTDALGHVTTISAYDADGRPLTLQDPNGLVTQLAYDLRGRLLSRNTGGETTIYSYDAAGLLLKITQPDASFAAFSYDPAHRLTQISDNLGNKIVYTLDANDNQTQKQVYDPSGNLTRSLGQTFDAVNRLQTSVGAQGQTTTFGYDSNGNLTSVTDPLSNVTTRSFDALNRLIASFDPLSDKTQYQFDANDNLAQVTDPRSANTVYTYDGLGNKTQQTSPDTGTTTYTYDAAGNIISHTDARGVQTLYSYDALNRLVKKSFTPNSSYGDISSATKAHTALGI